MIHHAVAERPAVRFGTLRATLAALLGRGEPVELVERRFNFLPQRFRWRGDLLQVRRVVAIRDRAAPGAPRRYFEVVCQDGATYVLFQDLRIGTWHMRGGGYVPVVV